MNVSTESSEVVLLSMLFQVDGRQRGSRGSVSRAREEQDCEVQIHATRTDIFA